MNKKLRKLYLNPNSEENERSVVETFIELEPELKGVQYRKEESPDFIFDSNDWKIGVEVTTLIHKKIESEKSQPAAIRNSQQQALIKGRKMAEESDISPLEVKVRFQNDFKPIKVNVVAKELFDYVCDWLPEIENKGDIYSFHPNLKYIDWIQIQSGVCDGKNWLKEHRWERIHGGWVVIDPIDKLTDLITRKDGLYRSYMKKCDECWLLISVNEWTTPEAFDITEITLNHTFYTQFHRVYFLRNIENKLWRLK